MIKAVKAEVDILNPLHYFVLTEEPNTCDVWIHIWPTEIKGTRIEGMWEYTDSSQFKCTDPVVWLEALSSDTCWVGFLALVRKSRGLLSRCFLILGKELQTMFEEGGSEDLVITTKGKKKENPGGHQDDKTFLWSVCWNSATYQVVIPNWWSI